MNNWPLLQWSNVSLIAAAMVVWNNDRWRARRAEFDRAEVRGPSVSQPSATPLGQTDSQHGWSAAYQLSQVTQTTVYTTPAHVVKVPRTHESINHATSPEPIQRLTLWDLDGGKQSMAICKRSRGDPSPAQPSVRRPWWSIPSYLPRMFATASSRCPWHRVASYGTAWRSLIPSPPSPRKKSNHYWLFLHGTIVDRDKTPAVPVNSWRQFRGKRLSLSLSLSLSHTHTHFSFSFLSSSMASPWAVHIFPAMKSQISIYF